MLRQIICGKEELEHLLATTPSLLDEITTSTARNYPDWFYETILEKTIPVHSSNSDSEQLFYDILIHREILRKKLERPIHFTVAALDLLASRNELCNKITVVESSYLEKAIGCAKEDPKTGCYNTSFFRQLVEEEIKRAERHKQKLSIIMLDLDNFKKINNSIGHMAADDILIAFADILKSNVRTEDSVGRFGGDEFMILLPQTGRIGARCLAERVQETINEHFKNNISIINKQQLTFSGGIATYPQDGTSYEQLMKQADTKLYHSKDQGKNCIHDLLTETHENIKAPTPTEKEKREHARYNILQDGIVDIHPLSQAQNNEITIQGKIVNISSSGILVECDCKLPKTFSPKKLEIDIKKLGHEKIDGFNLPGVVVRLKKSGDNLKFLLAIQFEYKLKQNEWDLFQRHTDLIYA